MSKKQVIGLIVLIVFVALVALILFNVTYFEDQSARVFGHCFCLGDYCGGVFNPEVLQSNDISEGYLVLGIYQDYRAGGLVTCYHDINLCIFSG